MLSRPQTNAECRGLWSYEIGIFCFRENGPGMIPVIQLSPAWISREGVVPHFLHFPEWGGGWLCRI